MNVLVQDNTMRAIGDAIREKAETEQQYLPSEMPQAIRDISGGETPNGFDKIASLTLINNIAPTNNDTFILDLPPNVTSLADLFTGDYAGRKRNCDIIINAPNGNSITSLYRTFRYNLDSKYFRTITLNFDTSKVTNFGEMFTRAGVSTARVCCQILGTPLDFSSATSVSNMFNGYIYDESQPWGFRIKENTLKLSINLAQINITNETLQSLINGLAPVTSATTLTLNAEVKARLTTEQLAIIEEKGWTA